MESSGDEPASPDARARSRNWVIAGFALLIVAAALATALTIHNTYPHGTGDLDEASYQAQANAIAAGKLTLPRATYDPYFRPFLSGVHGDHVVFKYQPVWPALIALSDGAFGSSVPLRILMSICGVLATAWLAWELLRDERAALVAGLLVVASPFVWVQSASILSYQLSFVAGTAAAAALARACNRRTFGAATIAGALLGLAVLHRPFDAVLAGVPAIVWALWRSRRAGTLRTLITGVGLGALPFAVLFFAYNTVAMGSPIRLPFTASGTLDQFGFGWRASYEIPNGGHGGQLHYTPWFALRTLQHLWVVIPRFVAFAPVVGVCVAIAVWSKRRDDRMWLLLSMIMVIIVGYYFWWGTANEFHFRLEFGLGPFYHYPLLGPLFVLAAWGFMSVKSANARLALVFVGVLWAGWASVVVMQDANLDGKSPAAELAALKVPGPALVLQAPSFPNDPYLRYANDGNLEGKLVVAVDRPGERLALIDRFPDRTPYLLRSFRRYDDPFGPILGDRIALDVQRASSFEITATTHPPFGITNAMYMRIGNQPAQFANGASVTEAKFRVTPQALQLWPNATTQVAIGFTTAAPGMPAVKSLDRDWAECRFEMRYLANGLIEALTPCEGWHHYSFVNGQTATNAERLDEVLTTTVTPAG